LGVATHDAGEDAECFFVLVLIMLVQIMLVQIVLRCRNR